MKKNRDLSIDILRGWAITFMIVSHTIFFRYGLGNGLFNTLLNFANGFCYITFLFTFGAGIYHSMLNTGWDSSRRIKIGKRIISLLLIYYLVGSISLWSYYPIQTWNLHLLLQEAWRIMTFRYYASFTEYIPTFVLFMFIFYLLRTFIAERLRIWFSDEKILMTLTLAVLTQFGANWLSYYMIAVPLYLRPLIGSTTTYDFPILQYCIVVIMGIWSASWDDKKKSKFQPNIIAIAYGLLVSSLVIRGSSNYNSVLGWIPNWINSPTRWPPSLSFILSGLSTTYLFWIISKVIVTISFLRPLTFYQLYMGQRALGFLVYHLLLLFIAKILNIPQFDIIEILIFCILIPLSYATLEKGLALIRKSRYNVAHEKV